MKSLFQFISDEFLSWLPTWSVLPPWSKYGEQTAKKNHTSTHATSHIMQVMFRNINFIQYYIIFVLRL